MGYKCKFNTRNKPMCACRGSNAEGNSKENLGLISLREESRKNFQRVTVKAIRYTCDSSFQAGKERPLADMLPPETHQDWLRN